VIDPNKRIITHGKPDEKSHEMPNLYSEIEQNALPLGDTPWHDHG